MVQVSCQYHHWFWSYNTLLLQGLTRNLEIGNSPVWVLGNIWRLGQGRDTKFGTHVSNELLRNAKKCQDYSFSDFWVIKGKPTAQIRVKYLISEKSDITDSINNNFGKIRMDSCNSLPIEKISTFHNVIRLIKSVVNKNKSEYYCNLLLETGLYNNISDTPYF